VRVPERWTEERTILEGRRIDYRLYVPPILSGVQPARSLVLMLHGCQQDPLDFALGTGMNELARTRNVVVVYPEQKKAANSHGCWNWFKPQHQQRDRGEPAMLAGLTREVMRAHDVDPARVYVAGLSAGASMAVILAECHPDLFVAAGAHSGLPRGAASDAISALAAMRHGVRPALGQVAGRPMIVFQGDADEVVHPDNGVAVVEAARGIDLMGGPGARRIQGASSHGRRFTRTCYPPTAVAGPVEHWELHGIGHAWSGGDAQGSFTDPAGVPASAEMLRFFLENPRRPGA
jgi:poly(hydroxyalkanoate) depolymerase family esterase